MVIVEDLAESGFTKQFFYIMEPGTAGNINNQVNIASRSDTAESFIGNKKGNNGTAKKNNMIF